MITNNVSMYLPGGPGHWNDPDMLQVRDVRAECGVCMLHMERDLDSAFCAC
jgi:hypothetical protein